MKTIIENWRCIERIEFDVKPITIFIGKNSTGKSSIVYALYFLSKVKSNDPLQLAQNMYGLPLNGIVRKQLKPGEKSTLRIFIEDNEFTYDPNTGNFILNIRQDIWKDSALLPSSRIDVMKSVSRYPQILQQMKGLETQIAAAFSTSILNLITMIAFPPPSILFIEDYMRIILGKEAVKTIKTLTGEFLISISVISMMINYVYKDPYIDLKIPLSTAPDGEIDTLIIKNIVNTIRKNSLLVIEEPENHKNPLALIDLMKEIFLKTIERRLTLLITTHNDLLIHVLLKLIEEGRIKPDDTAVYYVQRTHKDPWTRLRRLRISSNGVIEEIPDFEEASIKIF